MAKRLTKQQKIELEKTALYQRIEDIVLGACNGDVDQLSSDACIFPKTLGNILQAMKAAFDPEDSEELKHLWFFWNFEHYERVDKMVEFYFNAGVRA